MKIYESCLIQIANIVILLSTHILLPLKTLLIPIVLVPIKLHLIIL